MKVDIVFDGGAKPNPGHGYGSFQISVCAQVLHTHRCEFGFPITNNQAEWLTLERALEYALNIYGPRVHLLIRGDSALVINGASRKWKVKHANLKPIAARVFSLASKFDLVTYIWHPRIKSVTALGH